MCREALLFEVTRLVLPTRRVLTVNEAHTTPPPPPPLAKKTLIHHYSYVAKMEKVP
jgi:hypothetical protein